MVATLISALTSGRGQLWLLSVAAIGSGALLAVLAVPAALARDVERLQRSGALLTMAAVAVSLLALTSAHRLARSRPMRWLATDARAFGFFLRLAAYVLAGIAGFVVYKFLLDGIASAAGYGDPYAGMSRHVGRSDVGTWIVGIGLLAAWPVCMYLFVLGQAGAIALGATALARIAAAVVRVVRAG